MKKLYRVRKNEEFSKIISQRHSFSSGNFVMYVCDKTEANARVGISVSKKLGNAVNRNRIKRQLREMIRALVDFENCGKDMIIIVRTPFLNCSYQENLANLEKLIKKAII